MTTLLPLVITESVSEKIVKIDWHKFGKVVVGKSAVSCFFSDLQRSSMSGHHDGRQCPVIVRAVVFDSQRDPTLTAGKFCELIWLSLFDKQQRATRFPAGCMQRYQQYTDNV